MRVKNGLSQQRRPRESIRGCLIGLSVILVLGLVGASGSAGGDKKYQDPTPRKEDILKLFLKEFIDLNPGKDKYPGSFQMGSAKGKPEERLVHKVVFAEPFAMAKYEVTQELYHVVMGNNPSKWKGPRNSVEMINWDEAKTFCEKVTKMLRERKLIKADQEIRLPSEAEWEYVCRAGSDDAYSFGNNEEDLTFYAWYDKNSKGYDPPVGAKKPNAWGFYDMHGYIMEWCADDWVPNYEDAPTDGSPQINKKSQEKVLRGGSWASSAEMCRSAHRMHALRTAKDDKIGFRCVLAQSPSKGSIK